MQVSELVALARFLSQFIRDRGLVGQYDQLVAAVNQASQNQQPENVLSALERIEAIHRDASNAVLSVAQRKLLSDFGGDSVLGLEALARVKRIVAEHTAHPQGMIRAVEALKAETNTLVERSNSLVVALEPMLAELVEDEPHDDEGRLWLYFSESADITTVAELEKAAKTWNGILRNFALLPGASSGGRILSIGKSSPLELELAASLKLLVPLAIGIKFILHELEHVIRIAKQVEELKQLKVKTKIIQDLRGEAETERKKIAATAAAAVVKEFKGDGEARNAVEVALKSVLHFIEIGGQLDIDAEKDDDASAENGGGEKGQLKMLVEMIRREMKLLPAGMPTDATDEESEAQ